MRPSTLNLAQFVVATLAIVALTDSLTSTPTASPVLVVHTQSPPVMQVDAKAVARELLTKEHYKCFTQLIAKESEWNPKSKNPTSTAKGIGQLLDDTYRNLGMKHSEAEVPQLVATLAYIGRRYGSGGPCSAWAHWEKHNWY